MSKLAFVQDLPITESELEELGKATWRIYGSIADDLAVAKQDDPSVTYSGIDITEICLDADRLLVMEDRKDLWELYRAACCLCNPHDLNLMITAAAGLMNEEI